VEELVFYFTLLRPTATNKINRYFSSLDALGKNNIVGTVLSAEEQSEIYEALANNNLGTNTSGKQFAIALLKRLNRYIKNTTTNYEAVCYLEPILPIKATKRAWRDV